MIDAFCTVMLGSWTRINGAGMTCPDWPTCHGVVFPSMADGTVWEWTHRLFAVLLAPLALAVIGFAWRERKSVPYAAQTAGAIGALFIVQVLLGAATVHLSNSPMSVVLHWGTGMALIASLAAMAIFSYAAPSRSTRREPDRSATAEMHYTAAAPQSILTKMCAKSTGATSGDRQTALRSA